MNLNGEIYEVEVVYPTNSGSYSLRKLFTSEREAKEFAMSYAGEDYEHLDICEWTPEGPNWSTLEVLRNGGDEVITISRIDNTYKEER